MFIVKVIQKWVCKSGKKLLHILQNCTMYISGLPNEWRWWAAVRDTQICLSPTSMTQENTHSDTHPSSQITFSHVGLLPLKHLLLHHCNYWCYLVKSYGRFFCPQEGCKGGSLPFADCGQMQNSLTKQPPPCWAQSRDHIPPTSSPSQPSSHSLPSSGHPRSQKLKPCRRRHGDTGNKQLRVKLLPKA